MAMCALSVEKVMKLKMERVYNKLVRVKIFNIIKEKDEIKS